MVFNLSDTPEAVTPMKQPYIQKKYTLILTSESHGVSKSVLIFSENGGIYAFV